MSVEKPSNPRFLEASETMSGLDKDPSLFVNDSILAYGPVFCQVWLGSKSLDNEKSVSRVNLVIPTPALLALAQHIFTGHQKHLDSTREEEKKPEIIIP